MGFPTLTPQNDLWDAYGVVLIGIPSRTESVFVRALKYKRSHMHPILAPLPETSAAVGACNRQGPFTDVASVTARQFFHLTIELPSSRETMLKSP
jgi:hypothetical protein